MGIRAYLSIGSNLGDRVANLTQAVALLGRRPEIHVDQVSPLYETEPVGGVVQANFYNLAVRLTTRLSPNELLAWLHVIEQTGRRQRLIHWGPRTIDLDLLFYGQRRQQTASLTLPHPEVDNRRFVLVPLLTVATPADARYWHLAKRLQTTPDHNWVRLVARQGGIWHGSKKD